ncbi:type II toxin-antitoxin system RelE/ParE family toxin [Aquimarina sediminis]|uniref:type II toxin-antitoxin system RelE/ParE family toxin n=1 Tax=Aquimarina sediminis TaxID=2070536 RepID=UPI000CA06566|nr:type II toxin-antitoxin system RelE/ParE family toxin [Aquimarina sediminis]
MKYELEIKEEANLEMIKAYLYYEEQQIGLGERFFKHLDTYIDRIQTNPEHYPSKRPPYREAWIKKYPYLIIYEIIEKKVIIYSVFNTWQHPKKKL